MTEEILNRLDKIKQLLDEFDLIKNLLETKQVVFQNKYLITKIDKYKQNPFDDNLKKEIYSDKEFLRYKQLENELYYLILEINKHLNSLTSEKSCKL